MPDEPKVFATVEELEALLEEWIDLPDLPPFIDRIRATIRALFIECKNLQMSNRGLQTSLNNHQPMIDSFVRRNEFLETQYKSDKAKIAKLEQARDICHGTTKDMLDGKPMPGNWSDGTDGACPGWWRGQEYGAEIAVKEMGQLGGKVGILEAERDTLAARIAELKAEIAQAASEIPARETEPYPPCSFCSERGHSLQECKLYRASKQTDGWRERAEKAEAMSASIRSMCDAQNEAVRKRAEDAEHECRNLRHVIESTANYLKRQF